MKMNAKRKISSFLAFTLFVSSMTLNNVSIYAEDEASFADGFALTNVEESVSEEALDFSAEDLSTFDVDTYAVPVSDIFMCEDSIDDADVVLVDNDYGTAYSGQKLTAAGFTANGLVPVEVGGVTFDSKIKTNSVNTAISALTGDTGVAAGTFRFAYKIVAKQDCKVTVYACGGNHALILDENSADGQPADITPGVGTTTGSGVGKDIGFISGTGVCSADIQAGQIAYFGGRGTNDNFLGVKIEKGSAPVNPNIKITLDGEAITEAQTVKLEGFRATADSDTTDANGNFVFSGLSTYDYTITAKKDGVTYQGVLSVAEDGSYSSTLDLSVIAAEAGVTIKDANGNPVTGARVTLDYLDDKTPKKAKSVTDEFGFAAFESLTFKDYTVSVDGYTVENDVFAPKKGALTAEFTATAKDLPTVPADAKAGDTYAGYAPSEVSFYTVQEAVDAAAEGGTVHIAAGEYREMVVINKSVNLVGEGKDKTFIAYNDSQQGTDSGTPKTRFHGDTVVINAENATVNFDDLAIVNDAEATIPDIVQNATALSSYLGSGVTANTINVTNCDIIATRDTIYTGPATSLNQWTFTSCGIYGFQDVVCGGGNAALIDCDWVLNMNSDARLLVPQCRTDGNITVMTAEGLEIVQAPEFVKADAQGATFTKAAYLGRPWGNGSAGADTTHCVVYSYADEGNLVPETAYNGYDADNGLSASGGLAAADWLVCVKDDEDGKIYASSRWLNVNKLNKSKTEKTEDGILVAGEFNKELAGDIDAVGFAVYDNDGAFVGVTKSSTVYKVKGGDGTMFSVNYVEGMDSFKVKAYLEQDGVGYIYGANNASVSMS